MPILLLILSTVLALHSVAQNRTQPLHFELKTEKESYYEGDKVTFLLTVQNASQTQSYPVLLPGSQNSGQKLLYFNVYDKASNVLIKRFTEELEVNMLVKNLGTIEKRILQPQEKIELKLYWNDWINYFTSAASHHSFGVPLFAGHYKIDVCYNPYPQYLATELYSFYKSDDHNSTAPTGKLSMHQEGQLSNMIDLKIRKTVDSVFTIEGTNYYTWVHEDRNLRWYYEDSVGDGGNNIRHRHVTNLPNDSFSIQNEYFYSFFPEIFNEFITRYPDNSIREYRKWRNECPEEILTLRYNQEGRLTYQAKMMADSTVQTIKYDEQGSNILKEEDYSADGTRCKVTEYIYNKREEFVKTKITETESCVMDLFGKSYRRMMELQAD